MSKYRAVPTTVDNVRFASKREASQYENLKMLQKCGYITDLELQPKYPLVVNGKLVCTVIPDFRYKDREGNLHVEDAKGVRTPVFKIKAKLFEALYGMRIEET